MVLKTENKNLEYIVEVSAPSCPLAPDTHHKFSEGQGHFFHVDAIHDLGLGVLCPELPVSVHLMFASSAT